MIQLTRWQSNREAAVFVNPALIEFVREAIREDRSGRTMTESGSELGTVSGERMRVIESPAEVAHRIAAMRMMPAS